jgi:hypothetical protein
LFLKTTSPNIIEPQKREVNGSIQKLLGHHFNSDTIKNFLLFVDNNGMFSLAHSKQQQLFNKFRHKMLETIETKHGPKHRYKYHSNIQIIDISHA